MNTSFEVCSFLKKRYGFTKFQFCNNSTKLVVSQLPMWPADKNLSQKATEFLQYVKKMLQNNKRRLKQFLIIGPVGANMKQINLNQFKILVSLSGFSNQSVNELFSEFSTGNSISTYDFISMYERCIFSKKDFLDIQQDKYKDKDKYQQKSPINIQRKLSKNKLLNEQRIRLPNLVITKIQCKYYRLGEIKKNHVQYCQELNNLIKSSVKFKDTKNPIIKNGSYKYVKEIFNDNKNITYGKQNKKMEPKDIATDLVNFNFLSGFANISLKYPEIINDKFLFTINASSYYVVNLFVDGKWQFIVTDDQFPCKDGKPIYAKPNGNSIWVMLLEKCWAKVFGSYESINGGSIIESLGAITGAPCERIYYEKKQEKNIKIRLQEAIQKKYVCTAGESKHLESLQGNQKNQIGLVSGCPYSILNMLKINGERIVELKYLWGEKVWKGDWSFSSKKWTEELRKKYHYQNDSKDGTFYIGWDSFIKYFTKFTICRVNPKYTNTSLELQNHKQNPAKTNYLKLVVKQSGVYNISIYQESYRKNSNAYCPLRFTLVKDNNGLYEYIHSVEEAKYCTSFQKELKQGTYYLSVKVQLKKKALPLILSSYGVSQIQIQQIDYLISEQFKKKMLKSYSQKFRGRKDDIIPGIYHEFYYSISKRLGYIKIKNSTNKSFKLGLKKINFEGLVIMTNHQFPIKLDLKPNTEQIIGLYVTSNKPKYEYRFINNFYDGQVIIPFYRSKEINDIGDFKYCQELKYLLKSNYPFKDKYNPFTHQGSYQSGQTIFKGAYQMTEQAGSVQQRSRITQLQKKIQPKDIIQRRLGDCYFLSALSAIVVHYPEVIDKLILFAVNPSNYYVVKLFVDGQWQYIVTDDQFPCQNGKPVFAQPHGRQIWVMLLEKCFAKVFGAYQNIEYGRTCEIFILIAGAPSQQIFFQKQEDKITIKQKLWEANNKHYVCTATDSGYQNHRGIGNYGLVRNHSYSIMKLIEINGETIVKLRNPWGENEWEGDWSFYSPKWTPQLRYQYNYVNDPRDGTFFIGWNSFITFFGDFNICKINPHYKHSSFKLSPQQTLQKMLIKLYIYQEGNYHISVYQEDKRKNRNYLGYEYSPLHMLLMDEDGKYINSILGMKQCSSIQSQLEKGIYYLQVTVNWKKNAYPIIISTYGESQVQMKQADYINEKLIRRS